MLHWISHQSTAISGFPMGDNPDREFPVFLPPNYDAKRTEPYPVIFILTGFSCKGVSYAYNETAYTLSLPQKLTQAIHENKLPACIVVFPDGSSKLGCSQYINSPAFGNYMDYFCHELVDCIDMEFNTHRDKNFRGVMGHSSGGFGALIYAMKKPDVFQFVCSSAGDSFFEASLLPNVVNSLAEIEKAGGVSEFVESFLASPNPGGMSKYAFITMLTIAMAPCFAPNVEVANIYGDLFFDLETGAIKADIWQKYLAWDPVHMVKDHVKALQSLKWLHLAAGMNDEYGLQWGHRQFAKKLQVYDIEYHLQEYPGGHSGQGWRFTERIGLMLEKMGL